MFPSLQEYVDAIKAAEDNFEQLQGLRPILDADGTPVMSSGNFAVVFKMKDEQTGKLHAVKCFLKEQEGRAEAYRQISEELKQVSSPYLTPILYLEKELFVDSKQTNETEFPVLLMDWVEGMTFDKYLRENIDDLYALEELAYRFSQLAQWLIQQPFAHGDLKPDNILVREDGSLVLVDYDGMYVPAMKGQRARELGSPDFRHPLRTENDFDEHIDDFPCVSILLSLYGIFIHPEWLSEYGAADRLLLSEKDYRDVSKCRLLKEQFPSDNATWNKLVSFWMMVSSQKTLSSLPIEMLQLEKPQTLVEENLSTEVTEEDLENAWEDEYGVKYSADKKRLLWAPRECERYTILNGTKAIGDSAFEFCNLTSIHIPDSMKSIGDYAFNQCYYLTSIHIPDSVTSIGDGAFAGCRSLTSIKISDHMISIGEKAFVGCESLTSIHIPNSVTSIGKKAFAGCRSLTSIHIPDSVTSIGDGAFAGCRSLTSIKIPDSVTTIGKGTFDGCESLTFIHIPDSVTSIGDGAFAGCRSLTSIKIPDSVTTIGKGAFDGCESLTSIHIPDSVTTIGKGAFSCCKSRATIFVPKGSKGKFEWMLLERHLIKEE